MTDQHPSETSFQTNPNTKKAPTLPADVWGTRDKTLNILPGKGTPRISHAHSSLDINVQSGTAEVITYVQGKAVNLLLKKGENTEIPLGAPYEIKNCGDESLIIEQTRHGYLGIDDLIIYL